MAFPAIGRLPINYSFPPELFTSLGFAAGLDSTVFPALV